MSADALVITHEAISIHNADSVPEHVVPDKFYEKWFHLGSKTHLEEKLPSCSRINLKLGISILVL